MSGFIRRTLQAADENNIPFLASALTFDALLAAIPLVLLLLIGLTHVAHLQAQADTIDLHELLARFLPAHVQGFNHQQADPFAVVERLLGGVVQNRGQLSLYAIPAFLWFSTRLFAGVRTSLNEVFDVSLRPTRRRGILLSYLLGKLRDLGMVIATLALFLANTAISTSLQIIETRGTEAAPQLHFFLTFVGRVLGELLALVFGISLFFVVYKYASLRRLPWRAALVAAAFTAVAFEVAKRLYGLYLAGFASAERVGTDANIGALILFVLWVYYTGLVFLFGGVVAETWDLRERQQRQRAILI